MEFFAIRQRTDANDLLELARKRGLVGISATQGDLGDDFSGGGQALTGGINADFDYILTGGEVEQEADALVELIDGKTGHFGEGGQAEGIVIVAVDVIDDT